MANASFSTNPGGPAPTTFHDGPRPQPKGAVPAVAGRETPPVMSPGSTPPYQAGVRGDPSLNAGSRKYPGGGDGRAHCPQAHPGQAPRGPDREGQGRRGLAVRVRADAARGPRDPQAGPVRPERQEVAPLRRQEALIARSEATP